MNCNRLASIDAAMLAHASGVVDWHFNGLLGVTAATKLAP